MTTELLTYRTGESRRETRTVVVIGVREADVLLPGHQTMRLVLAELLEGRASAHAWWAEQLGLDPESHDFACSADQVVARRELTTRIKTKRRH